MDNDTLYQKAQEWLEAVDAETLKRIILNECVLHIERWD